MNTSLTPLSLDQVADHLERMLLRYEELQKSNALLQAQLLEVEQERDALRTRLATARARVDALLARLPEAAANTAAMHKDEAAARQAGGAGNTAGPAAAQSPASLLATLTVRQQQVEASGHETPPALRGEESA